jgi:hypothetical protein
VGSSVRRLNNHTVPNPYTVLSERRCALIKVLEVMAMNVYTGLNPFNFIRKHFPQICVQKVAVHLYNVLEVMSASVYIGLKHIYVP